MTPIIATRSVLRPIFDGRAYLSLFPQDERGNPTTKWPASRFQIVSAVPPADVCGTGDTSADDTRVQIDVVANSDVEALELWDQVIAGMSNTDPPCVRETHALSFDQETRKHRVTGDFTFYASSTATT